MKNTPTVRMLSMLAIAAAALCWSAQCRAETEVQALFRTGYSQLKAGNFSDAAARFTRGLQMTPDDAIGHFYLGMSYSGLGQGDLANQEFLTSLRIDNKSSVANQALRQFLSGKTFDVSVDYDDTLTGGPADNIVYCRFSFTRRLSLSFGRNFETGRLTWKRVQTRTSFDEDAAFRSRWTKRDQSDLEYLSSQNDIVHQGRAEAKQRQLSRVSEKVDEMREECRSSSRVSLIYSVSLPVSAASEEATFVVLESDADDSPVGKKESGKFEILDNGKSLRLEWGDLLFVMKASQ